MSTDLDALLVTMHQTTKDLVALGEAARGDPYDTHRAGAIHDQCQRLAYAALWAQHAYLVNGLRYLQDHPGADGLKAAQIHTEYALQSVHASKYKSPIKETQP